MAWLEVVVLLLTLATLSHAEVFTALVDLENVIYTESNMLEAIKMYVQGEEKKLEMIKQRVAKLDGMNREAVNDPEHYLGHPVNGYLLVKRFIWEWTEIENMVRLDKPKTEYLVNITQYREFMPDSNDLSGAAAALLRLQDTYRLETSSIASGKIEGTWTTPQLSAHECFELGRVAYNANDHYHTILWMKESLNRLEAEKTPSTEVSKATILDYLAWAVYQSGHMKEALKYTNELLEVDPDHERALNNKAFFDYHMAKAEGKMRGDDGDIDEEETEEEEKDGQQEAQQVTKQDAAEDSTGEFEPERPSDQLPERTAYEALCRGEEEAVAKLNKPTLLKCTYQHYGRPELFLSPAKEEVVFLRPYIIMYREILSDKEMDIVKGIAAPRLNRATIQNSVTGQLEYADYRISKSAWLKPDQHEIIMKIRNRVNAYTGLDLDTAEDLQVVNYGIGGHYEPHFDFARREKAYKEGNRIATMLFYKEEVNAFKDLGTGNRIATTLFYMSDVEAGGATVFPMVGARVLPAKGSAAFWYNLHPSGDGNYDTRHAACPVLAGSKWVSNIWIHEMGQEFRHKCDINRNKY